MQTASVGELLQHIEHLKEKVITRPYAIRYRVQLNKALKAVADFLEFAAEQEEKIGSRAQALHLRSSAALYRGNMERAQLLFREYMKYLPENQSNLASQLFVRNAMMHGQKVSEQIEDSDGKPFYDRYGRPIHARLLDDTLQYGSETSDVTQQRLIQRAREFEEMNELYYSRIVARAASNLTDPSRNYRYTQLNLALMLSSGRTGYSSSMLAQGGQSYGAYTNTQLRRNVVGEVIPRVSYLYDAGYTRELVKNKKIFLNEEDALSDVSLPPSRIAAILVNPIHLPDVLGSLSDFPTRNMPILDTEGNLLWENVTIETVARKYEKAYQSHKKDVVVRREISSADYTYVKKVNNPERIVAIGDVQSDYAALSKILQNTGIIDQNGTLIAQSGTVVVINGDFCDKGTGEAMKKTIDLVMNLQKQAEGTGIEIIVTLGNHEVRFLSGKWYSTSEKTLMDFLSIIGFDEKKAVELREALSKNDTAKLGFFISQYPDTMKYIHYLWHLPVIAQVGNHVFVHAGPTPAFNTQLRNVLNEYVGWSTEQAIDFIYSSAIREKGFNGYLFDDGFDSLFTAAPEWTPPHFIQDQSIVDAFLAFFDGASFLGVGHNKALGVLGNKEQFGKITRVGSRNNIIKLDVGVSHAANRNQKTTFAKAYIVDPRQADFIHSVDESNSRASLVLPSECRKSFMDTDVAAIYDLMFGGNNQRVDSPGSAEQDTSVSINEVFDQFYRKVFMIFTPVAGLKEAQFITETNRWLKVGEPLWNKTKERIDPVEDEKVYKVLERYIQYLYDIRAGIIDSELISLSHFKEYVQNMPLETGSAVSTKALHGREVDYKNNAPRVYAGLHQGKSKPFPSEIIGVVKDRLSQIIEQRRRFNAADYMTIEHLLQVNDLLTKREEYRSAFLLFTANDGNPGIFLDKEGDGVLGVGFHYEIYFGAPLAMYLWNMYIKTGDVEYLNKLTAFIVHESFEYINRYRVSPKKDLAELHSEAERLEVVVAGKGNTGSALDDEIDRLINEWFKENTDKEAKVKKQFLAEYGKYLRETGSFQQYKAVFKTLNIPIEGPALNEADMVNRLYMYLADRYPNQLFDALKSLYVNLEDVFIIIDEGAFTQSELFLLAMMLTEKTDSHETVDVAVLGGVFDFLNVTDLPRPKTSSMQQRSISQILRESSI
ncbi:metallophosphoesterase [bacterium]|nr:metallophosphoesterase [bacterium]MCP5462122.1 metallophosphoesterase [bacterium]